MRHSKTVLASALWIIILCILLVQNKYVLLSLSLLSYSPSPIYLTICVSGLPSAATYDVVFAIYGTLTLASFFLMMRVKDMGDNGSRVFDHSTMLTESTSALTLVCTDSRLLLLIPFQLCVGLAFSFVPFYVFGTIIADSDSLGDAYVGLISACIPLTGSAMAFPTAAVASRIGKPVPMTVGAVGLGMAGLAVICFSDATLGTWPVILVYIVIYGVGRGVYENTNKAVIVEFFNHTTFSREDDLSANATKKNIIAAFAATNFSRNIASAFGYFAFNHITRFEMSLLVLLFAVAGLFCYYAAHVRHQAYVLRGREGEGEALLVHAHASDLSSSSSRPES